MPRQGPAGNQFSQEAFLRWYAANEKVADKPPSDYSLMAVIAGKQGAALLKGSDGVSIAVRSGGEIAPGTRLLDVEPYSVHIEQNGVKQEISFPETSTPSPIGSAPATAATPSKAAPTGNRPGQPVKLRPLKITRGQMMAAMQGGNIAGWDKGLSSAPEGGIRLEKADMQPFAKLLQLRDGDLLKRINQRPLGRVSDISLVSFYLGQSASIDIELIRNGLQMVQHYDIQP